MQLQQAASKIGGCSVRSKLVWESSAVIVLLFHFHYHWGAAAQPQAASCAPMHTAFAAAGDGEARRRWLGAFVRVVAIFWRFQSRPVFFEAVRQRSQLVVPLHCTLHVYSSKVMYPINLWVCLLLFYCKYNLHA